MIYLFTGTPGAGKTLNAINFVLTDSAFNVKNDDGTDKEENGQILKRDVYYYNIKEVKHGWNELSDDQVKNWFELPAGSVIFIDECQDVFTGVQRNNALPPLYSRLNKHRHAGHDLILVTQGGSLLTSCIRPLVNRHVHLENENGGESAKWITKGEFIDNPKKKATRTMCEVVTKAYPKHLYGTYKSAELHTKKYRFPKIIKTMIITTLIVGLMLLGAGYYFYSKVANAQSAVEEPKQSETKKRQNNNSQQVDDREFKSVLPMDVSEYLAITTPRIAGIPHTAPLYDSFIASPQSAPKTMCYGTYRAQKYICKCFTEQMTALNTPYQTCINIVENGLYDVTLSTDES